MKCRTVAVPVLLALFVMPGCGKYYHKYRGMEGAMERAQEEVSTLVESTLKDPAKAEQAKGIMGQIVAEVKHSRQQNRESHQQLYDLNVDYDAEPEEFLKMIDARNAQRMQTASKILRLRFDLKELMTREEWKTFTDGLAEMRSRYRHPKRGEEKS